MPCKCKLCDECEGTGYISIAFDGTYLGKQRCDDFDEMDTCPICDGEGITYMCDECREAMDREEEEEYLRDCDQYNRCGWSPTHG